MSYWLCAILPRAQLKDDISVANSFQDNPAILAKIFCRRGKKFSPLIKMTFCSCFIKIWPVFLTISESKSVKVQFFYSFIREKLFSSLSGKITPNSAADCPQMKEFVPPLTFLLGPYWLMRPNIRSVGSSRWHSVVFDWNKKLQSFYVLWCSKENYFWIVC